MIRQTMQLKPSHVLGLKEVVVREIQQHPEIATLGKSDDPVYVSYEGSFDGVQKLRSVVRAYLVAQSAMYNPVCVSRQKSVLGGIIETVINKNKKGAFKTFKISCVGHDSV